MATSRDAVAGPSSQRAGPSSSSSKPKALAPVQSVPRTKFILIEYPGIVKPDAARPQPQRSDDDIEVDEAQGSTSSARASRPSNLDLALTTLAPEPPPYGNAGSALDHLGRVISLKSKVIECRPWAAEHQTRQQRERSRSVAPAWEAGAGDEEQSSSHHVDVAAAERAGQGAQLDLFKRPLTGEVVDTHDFVAVVQRRVWRRKKKGKPTGRLGDGGQVGDEVREYTIDPLGTIDTTVRWRKMSDFSYQPEGMAKDLLVDIPKALRMQRGEPEAATPDTADVEMASAQEEPSSPANMDVDGEQNASAVASSSAPAPPRGGLLSFYDALARMDIDSMRSFNIPTEQEDFEIEDEAGNVKSNLRLPPPPAFTRIDEPFPYSFRQPAASAMDTYAKRLPDGSTQEGQRWINSARWKGLAPTNWTFAQRLPVPDKPPAEVLKQKDRCDERLLDKLKGIFEDRPVWTRSALYNQFEDPDDKRTVQHNKEYIPMVAYAVADGAWSMTLIRLGYDLRDDPNSRFYQKVAFQLPTSAIKGRGAFKSAYGGAHASGSGATTARKAQMREEAGTEVGTVIGGETNDTAAAAAAPPNDGRGRGSSSGHDERQSHIFDGKRLELTSATFLLTDIIDEVAQPYIGADGPENLLDQPTGETGWYTALAWERIKAVVGIRFRKLVDERRPATNEEVEEVVAAVQHRADYRTRGDRRTTPGEDMSAEFDGGSAAGGSTSPPRHASTSMSPPSSRGRHRGNTATASTSMSPPSTRGRHRGSTATIAGSSRGRSTSAAGSGSSPERGGAAAAGPSRRSRRGSAASGSAATGEKKKPGRPKGSKNKKKAAGGGGGGGAASPTSGAGSGSD